MRKILLSILVLIFLMIGIPTTIVGIESLKKQPVVKEDTKTNNAEGKKDTKNVAKTDVKNAIGKDVTIKVYYTPEKKILSLPMEEYIKLVVSSEMPASFHDEALKAQAIAARSFLVPKLKEVGGKGCPKANGADVCSDVHCQAFIPKDERMKKWATEADAKWRKVSQAVEATKGQVLTYDNKIATYIKYFSTSTGKTEDSLEVFGTSQPYLKSVESKGEEVAPNFKSSLTIKREEFVNKIKSKYKDVKIDATNIQNQVKITEKTVGDRVKAINIGGKVLTGVEIRSIFGLKSAAFTLGYDKASVVFNVQGYGHGVGMSQWGANEMGKNGKTYKEILTHYYKGISIEDFAKYIK